MSKIFKPMSALAFSLLFMIIGIALYANWDGFMQLGWTLLFARGGITILHNGLAFLVGWLSAVASGATRKDKRALIMEVGIQNSGLAIVIILNFLAGFGGAAAIIGLWGTWHLIAGLTLVAIFRAQDRAQKTA